MEKRVNTNKLAFLGILAIILVFVVVFTFSKHCGEDQACFNKAFEKCSKAQVTFSNNESFVYNYEIQGKANDTCVTTIFLDKVGEASKETLRANLEGRGMVCEIPSDALGEDYLYKVKELSVHCTGPLKETLLQITLERLYAYVVNTFNPELLRGMNSELLTEPIS
jgi:hypothetical protein